MGLFQGLAEFILVEHLTHCNCEMRLPEMVNRGPSDAK